MTVGYEIETGLPPQFSVDKNSLSTALKHEPLVLAALDLDAPTPQNPYAAQVRHFLGGDFRVQQPAYLASGRSFPLANSTPALSDWLQPAPPAASDPHRSVVISHSQLLQ